MAKGKKNRVEQEESEEEMDQDVPAPLATSKSKKQSKVKNGEAELQEDDDILMKGANAKSKTKKGKKADVEDEENPGYTKVVKNAAKRVVSDQEDDDEQEKPARKPKPVKKTTTASSKKRNKNVSDDDSEAEAAPAAAKSAFALLNVEDDSDNDASSPANSDNEEEVVPKPAVTSQNQSKKKEEKFKEEPAKQGKKKGKKKGDDDEDLDQMLAELALEYEGKAPPRTELKSEAEEPEKKEPKKSKKKKKGTAIKEDDDDEQAQLEPLEDNDIKTKEPEESTKPKKKDKKKKKKEAEAKEKSEEPEAGAEAGESDTEAKDKPGKKKKGKAAAAAAAEEDDKKGKKGPGKKTIAAMQDALRKLQEDEERRRKEEEERERAEEEAEIKRLEELRLETERRELKKQREKEKREKLKAEGKLLTAKQKAALARTQASLEVLRAQGLDVPQMGVGAEKRPARPGTRVKPAKSKSVEDKKLLECTPPPESSTVIPTSPDSTESPALEKGEVKDEIIIEVTPEPEKEEVKDAWDAESSSDEEISAPIVEAPQPPARKPAVKTEVPKKKPKVSQQSEESGSEESDSESESESESEESSEDEHKTEAERKREKALERIHKRKEEAEKKRSVDSLRAPVICVLGHVDTGKTKILDKLRRTHVQDSEAGGITQQIGATNVPIEALKDQMKIVTSFEITHPPKIPGLLIIDTPGHESFSNLRSRGSSLCDMAILVVDIMHGLEPQTIESINLLKSKKTPFVVALNKIDRLYDWSTNPKKDVKDLLKSQNKNTQLEFEDRCSQVVVQLAEQGLNAKVYYDNPDPRTYVSLIPTSAITGDGMGNLMGLIVEFTQRILAKRLMYSDELQATVLEVKAIPGLGTTIDVILINGTLREGDTVILAGTDGPVVTQIRSLLMPQPMKELRVKNAYVEYKEVKAAQGIKIAAKELEKAIAGLNLLVAHHPDEVDICKEEVARELKSALGRIKLQDRGVYVQASTLGSLEALLEFLKTSEIPYANIRIGPVVKKDVMKASTMLEHDTQYAVILAFDVKVERDAQEMADSLGVRIFQADIIYHLFDRFMAYRDELKRKKREEFKHIAVFPCKLRILPQYIFNSRDPIVMGVIVEAGVVKEGTPVCVPSKEFVDIGIVTTIEINHKTVEMARKGQEVCIKIEPIPGETPKLYGRHFDDKDMIVSKVTRQSIDACKDYFRDDLQKTDWQLMVELKKMFQIL